MSIVIDGITGIDMGNNPISNASKIDSTIAEVLAQAIEIKNQEALTYLKNTYWRVIRELERLMLAGTELNITREALREIVK